MNCPSDGTKLKSGLLLNRGESKCEVCGGIFIKLDGSASSRISKVTFKPETLKRLHLKKNYKRISPANGTPMLLIKYREIHIDYCEATNSIWLDQGEIEKILERGGKKKKPKISLSKQLTEGLDAGLTANLDSIIDALISAF